jgi:hypothetical protein
MSTGWFAIAAALLTITGLVTLLAFFGTGSSALGLANDLNTIAMALVTVPVALTLHAVASRSSAPLASVAVGADFVGVALAAGFSGLLVLRVMSFDDTLIPITIGNGLIGVWLLITAALLLASAAIPAALGWLGIIGGAGLAISAMAFPILGREHPVIAGAGLAALIGLVGFYAWVGMLMLRDGLSATG